ncbi:ABC transporter permease [Enterococcus sp. 669A]|uniref:ABC transporter permease n=1 Tax=Candidatus Enterococcus moelleringii TaxID=2815325 RepID=A0ABS3LB96_9ENTE|nr:ABC transporter permease [Enterococcus sp. 669A]MBO1306908.1 ABC transporter permease [Enterococcus sp. 669A]
MRFSEIWKTAFKSIGKNKRRSFLTMIGLVIGVSAVITVFSIGRAFEGYMSDFVGLDQYEGQVSINYVPNDPAFDENGIKAFTEEDINKIENVAGVKSVKYDNYYSNGDYYVINTFDEADQTSNSYNFFKLIKDEQGSPVIYGRSIEASDNVNENPVIVIDKTTSEIIREENPESLVGQTVSLGGHRYEVVGIMADRESNALMQTENDLTVAETPQNVYEKYFDTYSTNTILVSVSDAVNVKDTSNKIVDTLKDEGFYKDQGVYQGEDLAGQVDTIRTLLTSVTLLVSVVGGISLFISGIGVMNMIYISVSERTKEIGVRRAMGGTRGNVMMQFLLEGISLTLLGGGIGFLFSVLFGILISMFTPLNVAPDLFTIVLAFGLSVVIGIVFSWLPAKSASQKDIVTLLR